MIRETFGRCSTAHQYNKLYPDAHFIVDGKSIFFEYENSSRGLSYHTMKYIMMMGKSNSTVLIVRSKNHVKKYKEDYLLARFAIENYITSNINFIIAECDGTLDNIYNQLANLGVNVQRGNND